MSDPVRCRLVHDDGGLNTGVWPVRPDLLVTPTDHFFTRSHARVPRLDPGAWRLSVDGLVRRPCSFSLEELGRLMPRRDVAATLVCAGLRRSEFLQLGPLPGELPWGPEAAGTGRWSGVALGDLLDAVGVIEGARYVELTGLDQVERRGRRFGFGGSIDLSKALSAEVLLATELNGAALPAAHGFPLRAVVPGWIGARSVKWLGRITLLAEPSPNYFQREAYRVQREVDPGNPQNVSRGQPLGEAPLNAVILDPVPQRPLPAGRVVVRGWAMGTGGRAVIGVELSPDGGHGWVAAQIRPREAWTWALWEAEVELRPGRHTLAARAADGSGLPQPAAVRDAWNVKGYNNNAWHRITIEVR